MTIKILSSTLVNKIAAGEVVERPASALKELLENSIDAGANKIDITIVDGGKSLIEVMDNGFGIENNEMELALTRHATSKLDNEDLMNITYLGFRGEALPSIGSVSRLSMTSRTKSEDSAWTIKNIGGNIFKPTPVSGVVGTKIEVSDLFFSTPARLKFLKTNATEGAYCEEVVEKIALSNPHIAFNFTNDKRQTIRCVASGIEKRIEDIVGKDFMDNAVKVEAISEGLELTGYVSIPTFNKANSKYQHFFVNGRSIKDRFLTNAVKSAFFSLMAPDRFPVVVLFLKINPEDVDVNVHPQKSEVRFKNNGLIRNIIISAIKNALNSGASNRSVSMDSVFKIQTYSNNNENILDNSLWENQKSFVFGENNGNKENETNNNLLQTVMTEVKADYPLGTAKLQVKNTYIISENDDGIVIVDQHAAHERLTYEKLNKEYMKGVVARQILLIPEVVELKSDEYEAIAAIKENLEKIGMVVEDFGKKAVIVRETPAILGNFDIKKLIIDLAITMLDYKGEDFLKDKIKDIIATMSCHGSIRAGRTMNIMEMNEMLRQIENEPNAGQCIHGRPTYIKMPMSMIEKLFLRK